MQPYANLGGDSGVIAYENGNDYIKVQFESGRHTLYTYTNISTGSSTVQHMQQLADSGHGLNSFISRKKPNFSERI